MGCKGAIFLGLAAPLLSGCVFAVVAPQAGSTIAAPPGAATANVDFVVDASTSVLSVAGTVIDGGGNPVATMTLANAGAAPPARHSNSNEWRATRALAPGSYIFRAVGTNSQGSQPSTPRAEAAFQVAMGTPIAAVTLSLSSPAGAITVPRGGTTALGFVVGQTATTGPVTLSATGLPSGVTLSPAAPTLAAAGGSAPLAAALAAAPTAAGSATARFVARSPGAADASLQRSVRVIPPDGPIRFLPAPSLSSTGPLAATSPDGAWRMTASRMGTSRVWTLRIARTNNPADAIDVSMATWGVSGGSDLGGLLFCPGSPTTTALVLSDDDETVSPPPNRPGVTYRAKVIRLPAAGAPQPAGQLEGLKFLGGVQPHLGFSGDCSIVGTWSRSAITPSERNVAFADAMITGSQFGGWTFADTATTAAPSFTASLTAGTLSLTGPQGQSTTAPLP